MARTDVRGYDINGIALKAALLNSGYNPSRAKRREASSTSRLLRHFNHIASPHPFGKAAVNSPHSRRFAKFQRTPANAKRLECACL